MTKSTNNQPSGVRTTAFDHAHPMAKRIFSRLKNDTKASREYVVKSIMPHLGEPETDRARACLQALRECESELGRVPSAHSYADWRAAHTNPEMWPTKGFIANTFERWTNATSRLSGDFEPDLRWTGRGSHSIAFTENDILDAIREWMSELKIETTPGGWSLQHPTHSMPRSIRSIKLPSEQAFLRWCRDHESDGKRRPTKTHAADRVFGTWANAVARASKAGSHSDEVRFLVSMSLASIDDRRELVMPFLKRAIKGHRDGLSGRGFDAWLELEAAKVAGLDQWVASTFRSMRLVWTFGSWENAIAEAIGNEAAATFAIRGRAGVTKDALIAAATQCAETIGRQPLNHDYVAWREHELTGGDPSVRLEPGTQQSIPSAQAFNRYWPKWSLMLEEVFGGEGQ